MSWENLIKRKKESYTRESPASQKRRLQREDERLGTKIKVDRMTPSITNLQMKNFNYEEMSRYLNNLDVMLRYFSEVYNKEEHRQTINKALVKLNELHDLVATLPSLLQEE